MDRRGRSRGMIPLLALHTFAEYYRQPQKPPVTAGLLAANTLIYLRPGVLDALLPTIDQVWFNPHLILKYKDYKRFFLSAFYHVGEPHLVYNMLSLLWKGTQLENMMGSTEFASMIAALLAMSQGITLLLSKSLLTLFDYDKPYYLEYSAGFSGVLFAMKVVLNSYSDDLTSVYGVLVPSRYAAWAELILIQMFVPGVSFLGHLGGILAGILYLRLKRSFYSGSDPLTLMFKGISGALTWPLRFLKRIYSNQQGRRRFVGRRNEPRVWRCQTCTYDNTGLSSVCEMCGNDYESDISSSPPHHQYSQDHLSLEELRRRRIDRFGRS